MVWHGMGWDGMQKASDGRAGIDCLSCNDVI